jgi:hypothetical protein
MFNIVKILRAFVFVNIGKTFFLRSGIPSPTAATCDTASVRSIDTASVSAPIDELENEPQVTKTNAKGFRAVHTKHQNSLQKWLKLKLFNFVLSLYYTN